MARNAATNVTTTTRTLLSFFAGAAVAGEALSRAAVLAIAISPSLLSGRRSHRRRRQSFHLIQLLFHFLGYLAEALIEGFTLLARCCTHPQCESALTIAHHLCPPAGVIGIEGQQQAEAHSHASCPNCPLTGFMRNGQSGVICELRAGNPEGIGRLVFRLLRFRE